MARCALKKKVGGFCCQVPPEPRCYSLLSGNSKCLIIVGISQSGPITVGTMPDESKSLYYARRSYFAPITSPPNSPPDGLMVEAPGTAPGSATLIPLSVYRHSRLPDPFNIGSFGD
ncbi:protein of unknown function [Magnetospira sp. QH-2]|nr:protein of unknown function [Magnetospira sp. QH-2]